MAHKEMATQEERSLAAPLHPERRESPVVRGSGRRR